MFGQIDVWHEIKVVCNFLSNVNSSLGRQHEISRQLVQHVHFLSFQSRFEETKLLQKSAGGLLRSLKRRNGKYKKSNRCFVTAFLQEARETMLRRWGEFEVGLCLEHRQWTRTERGGREHQQVPWPGLVPLDCTSIHIHPWVLSSFSWPRANCLIFPLSLMT